MSELIDLKDVTSMVAALNTPIATKEKILDILGDWTVTSTNILPCDTYAYSCMNTREVEHKLKPVTCVNCGGRIDKDTMTCCYCGTYYR